MTHSSRFWISAWLLISSIVVLWDAGYCLLRPRSMVGGDLHELFWKPYALYATIDYVYGVPSFERGDGFTSAQAFLNLIESALNFAYLYLAHLKRAPIAPLVGFTAVVMTVSKTVLYWAQEYFCGFCAVGHNDWQTLIPLWIVPNGLWIVVPSFIAVAFGREIATSLRQSDVTGAGKKRA